MQKKRCNEKEIQYWPPDWGEQFPKGLYTHGGWTIERAQIVRATACSDDTVLLRDDDDKRKGILWNVSAVDKPLVHGVDVVFDASPFLFFLFVPLKTIKPRLASEQAASGVDEQPPLTTSTTSTLPEDGLSDAATEHSPVPVPSPTPSPTAGAPTLAATTIARPATISDQ